jgi:hypothetical protein
VLRTIRVPILHTSEIRFAVAVDFRREAPGRCAHLPVPVIVIFCCPGVTLSSMLISAVLIPLLSGRNATLKMQLAPIASDTSLGAHPQGYRPRGRVISERNQPW